MLVCSWSCFLWQFGNSIGVYDCLAGHRRGRKNRPLVILFYRSLSFTGKEVSFVCEAASFESITQLEIRLDAADGPCIGVSEIDHSGGWADWKEYQCGISTVSPVFSWECGPERQFIVQMSSSPKFQSAVMYLASRS